MRTGQQEYELYLQFDTNCKVYSQWYFFSARGGQKGQRVRFHIMNLVKVDSLYNEGMRPCVYSHRGNRCYGQSWKRGGFDVRYRKNLRAKQKIKQEKIDEEPQLPAKIRALYQLSFSYIFQHDNDTVYFAHFFPYTFTHLQTKIRDHADNPRLRGILRIDSLCSSLAGNPIYCLTITNNIDSYLSSQDEAQVLKKSNAARAMLKKRFEIHEARQRMKQGPIQAEEDDEPEKSLVSCRNMYSNRRFVRYIKDHKRKKGVVLTARVHPGESNASFIMQGLMDFLLSPEARWLRQRYIFKVIPMLNPDGVIYGNYRCSLLGVDLNRRWPKPSKWLHPPIYYTKQLIGMFHIEREVQFFCDIHGHSRKKNVFMYGCSSGQASFEGAKKNNLIRILPLLLSQRNRCFSFKDCTFQCEKQKESTGRIVLYKELGIALSYTLQASFFGAIIPPLPKPKPAEIKTEPKVLETKEVQEEGSPQQINTEQPSQEASQHVSVQPTRPQSADKEEEEQESQEVESEQEEEGPTVVHFQDSHLKAIGSDFGRNLGNLMNPALLKRKILQHFSLRRSMTRRPNKSVSPSRKQLPQKPSLIRSETMAPPARQKRTARGASVSDYSDQGFEADELEPTLEDEKKGEDDIEMGGVSSCDEDSDAHSLRHDTPQPQTEPADLREQSAMLEETDSSPEASPRPPLTSFRQTTPPNIGKESRARGSVVRLYASTEAVLGKSEKKKSEAKRQQSCKQFNFADFGPPEVSSNGLCFVRESRPQEFGLHTRPYILQRKVFSPPKVQAIKLLKKPFKLPSISGTMIRSMGEPPPSHPSTNLHKTQPVQEKKSGKMIYHKMSEDDIQIKVDRDIKARIEEEQELLRHTESSPTNKLPLNVLLSKEPPPKKAGIFTNHRISNPGLPVIENAQFWANAGRAQAQPKRKKSKRREMVVTSLEGEVIGEMLKMSRVMPATSKARSPLMSGGASVGINSSQSSIYYQPQAPHATIQERRSSLVANSARQSLAALPHSVVVEEDDDKWNTTPQLMAPEDVQHFLNDIAKNSPASLPESTPIHSRLLRNMRQGARDLSETKKLLLSLNEAGLVRNLESLINTYQKDTRRNFDLSQVRKGPAHLRRLKEVPQLKGDMERSEYYEAAKAKGESPSVASKISHFSQRTHPNRVKNLKIPKQALFACEATSILTPHRAVQKKSPDLRINSQPIQLPRLHSKKKAI